MQTFRRQQLDKLLSMHKDIMVGNVIDIGGKKENKRGNFRPPVEKVTSWKYLNIDGSTNPDYRCNATDIPVPNGSFDTALLCEVLEHLEHPDKVLIEIHRVLKDGGALIASIPFLFPIHADPYDFQRWSDNKLISVLKSIGFSEIKIDAMGSIGSVVHDLLLVAFNRSQRRVLKSAGLSGLRIIRPILRIADNAFVELNEVITTGYFITARK